jgi:ribosomal protection tetracycline resistance protein
MRTLNLGILAHVDAGKTTLTERLLFAAGVIDAVGSVDHGNTQTDTLALERERGITIKTAVASFAIGDVTVNLIDTPGHPDFIAEVDRVLSLLDGAVLVISAVEGVQAQSRILMRALQRLGVPTLIFVNKIDRMGADVERVLSAIATKLSPAVIAMGRVDRAGTRDAAVASYGRGDTAFLDDVMATMAEHDDEVFSRYVASDRVVHYGELRQQLATWTTRAAVHPTFFGSAMTGAGIDELRYGLTELLPAIERETDGPASGVVFKIDRASTGERTAIVRLSAGTVRTRERLTVCGESRRVTGIAVFEPGGTATRDFAVGGQIARISGLGNVRIGDAIGTPPTAGRHHFSPPPFEAVVTPIHDSDRGALRSALDALADEDPLINVRQDELRGELSVSLYGEVQREVIRDTLMRDFGIAVEFSDTTIVCIERIAGIGEASATMPGGRTWHTPFLAGVGLRVEPAPRGTGVTFSPGLELGKLPLAFVNAVEEAVRDTLRQGLLGWEICDCAVSMISSGYWPRQSHAHGTFDKNMSSTASDFRLLTPLVLMEALRSAGTIVHEQVLCFHLEAPADALGPVTRLLANIHAIPEHPSLIGTSFVLRGLVPAARLRELRQHLPGLTRGEGFVETTFDSYQPIRGTPPTRARTDHNPLDRTHYLRHVASRTPRM